jgi:hypothetical protein
VLTSSAACVCPKIEENAKLLVKQQALADQSGSKSLQKQTTFDSRATKQAMLSWTQQTIGTTVRFVIVRIIK